MGNKSTSHYYKKVILILALFLPGIAVANVGKVIFISGTVITAPDKPLSRGDVLKQGDEIITGNDGRVQLLMQDGDRIAIRPNSRFQIEKFETLEEQANLPGHQPDGKRIYKVLEGGFRTLTSKAWKRTDENYQVKTPVATIGVRGTDYEVFLQKVLESLSGFGLYIAVHSGGVWVKNDAATTEVYDDEFLYIESMEDPGVPLIAPPELFSGESGDVKVGEFWSGAENSGISSSGGSYESRRSPDEEGEAGGSSTSESGGTTSTPPIPQQPIIAVNSDGEPLIITSGTVPQKRYVAFSSGPMGTAEHFSGTGFSPNETVGVDVQGNVTGFPGLYPGTSGPELAIYGQGTSSNVNRGFDPSSGLSWGRWAGGTATATSASGTENINLNNQSMHWIASGLQTQSTVLPLSGVAKYRLVGNTDPTDNLGNVGFMDGSTHMQADFTNQNISTQIGLSVNGQHWSAQDADGKFGQGGTFAGNFDSVQVNGGQCADGCSGSGGYSGFFTGGNGSAPPPGAGMGYGMTQGGATVSGAAAFGDPTTQ